MSFDKGDLRELWEAHRECQKEQKLANDHIRDEVSEVRKVMGEVKVGFASMKATVEAMLKDQVKTNGQVETIKKIMWGLLVTALLGCGSLLVTCVFFILEFIIKK